MKVWTIQPWSVWLQLKKNGVYYANENLSQLLHPRDHLLEDEFTKAYRWMTKQMKEKISLPPENMNTPIWCWYAQDDHIVPKNRYYSNQACIELELPANKILLSDFDLWHVVLMDGFVPPDDMDFEKYSREDDRIEGLPELEKQKIIEESWQHIFDVKKMVNGFKAVFGKLTMMMLSKFTITMIIIS